MASPDRLSRKSISSLLERLPRHDFLQAVRVLLRSIPLQQNVDSDMQAVAIKYHGNHAFNYPTQAIAEVSYTNNTQIEFLLNFLSFSGQAGSLPEYLRELILNRLTDHDQVLANFLDIFINRLGHMLYHTAAKIRHHYTLPLAAITGQQHDFHRLLLAVSGKQTIGQNNSVLDSLWMFFTGDLVTHSRSQESLTRILHHFLGLPISIKPLQGQWHFLKKRQRCYLGQACLGETTTIGQRVWLVEQQIAITIGPISLVDYQRILPNKNLFILLKTIIQQYCGEDMSFFIDIELDSSSLALLPLKHKLSDEQRLGWNTFLTPKQPANNPCFRVFHQLNPIYQLSKEQRYA